MGIRQELRHAVRGVRNQPFFAAIAIGTLALAVGATTAIFSVVHAVLLDPLPYPADDPDEVVFLTETHREGEMSVAYPNLKDWQRMNESFEALAGFREITSNLTGLEEPLRVEMTQVSKSYFEILGVQPVLGRLFSEEDDQAGAERVLVLNHRFWRNRFGGSADAIGAVLHLDEDPYSIIGILPEDFDLFPEERVFAALEPWAAVRETAQDRGNHQGILGLARLRDGVTIEAAVAEMKSIARRLETEYPATNSGNSVLLQRLSDRTVEDYRGTLWTLLGAVGLVLLIACANVANLLLVRAVSRKRIAAIQAALGASRGRLVRQGLCEGLVLAVPGGLLGIVLAYWGLGILRALLPEDVPRIADIGLDAPVLLVSIGISLSTGILFGSAPAFLQSRAKPSDPLREGSRDTGGGGAGRGLLVGEVAIATVLLIGAFLLIRTVYELTQVDPGFRTDRLLTMRVGIPPGRYEGETRRAAVRALEERIEALPGVESATLGLVLPMKGANWTSVFIVGDRPVPPRAELPGSIFTPVEPGYFETLSIPLLRGRRLEPSDTADAPRVAVVNETFARRFWPDRDPIGQRLKQGWPENEGPNNPWREIVGVVADVKQFGLGEESMMQVYLPLAQSAFWDAQLAIRTATDPMTLVEPAKAAVREVDASFPVYDVDTMEGLMRRSVAPRRFATLLLGSFAALALVLAAVGLYGVVAYSVARRTREIGLRMSVGADRSDIFRLVVRQGMAWALVGAAVGLAGAVAASRLLAGFLYGVTAWDPLTFGAAPVVLLATAFAASSAPALVASRVDPIRALRSE